MQTKTQHGNLKLEKQNKHKNPNFHEKLKEFELTLRLITEFIVHPNEFGPQILKI